MNLRPHWHALCPIEPNPRINVFLSEDFVLLVPSGDGHALRRLRVTLETQNVTTVIQIQKLYRYPRFQR